MKEDLTHDAEKAVRSFVLEKRGGTRVILSPKELRQRWEEDKCQAADRVFDKRTRKQFPAIALAEMFSQEKDLEQAKTLVPRKSFQMA